jgi:hypothetical protein
MDVAVCLSGTTINQEPKQKKHNSTIFSVGKEQHGRRMGSWRKEDGCT